MYVDLRAEAVRLLEILACSLIERETNPTQIFFSEKEVQIVIDFISVDMLPTLKNRLLYGEE